MLCVFAGTGDRAAQSVSGASAGPQDRMLHGMKAGAEGRYGLLWPTSRKRRGRAGLGAHFPHACARSSISFCGTSSLSLCPFPMIPSCCRRAGLKSWRKAVSAPSPCPPTVSTVLWASLCLVQGLTAGEEPPLSSLWPSLSSYRWPTQPQHRSDLLGSVSLRLGCSWLGSSGVLVLLLSISAHPGPLCVAAVFFPSHPCA